LQIVWNSIFILDNNTINYAKQKEEILISSFLFAESAIDIRRYVYQATN